MDSHLSVTVYWLLLVGTSVRAEETNCTVSIDQGTLVGRGMSSLYGRQYCAYLGIPYAQPPVGILRFNAPRPPGKWIGTLNATKKTSLCIGASYAESRDAEDEDCLYLNVYTPKFKPNSAETFSVLVFIPDDSYLGDESYLYGPDYLMDKGIIMVLVNYRVGPLGFLSTGNSLASGNFGLKDQVRALRWTRDNIEGFGGKPKSVTIHGHGGGGACVHYHLLSAMSKGLFHRAISQSGTALNPNMRIAENPRSLAQQMADITKCAHSDDVTLISCLKGLNPQQFANITSIPFAPVVEASTGNEEPFLVNHPLEVIRRGSINQVPWLMGSVSNEGAAKAADLFQNETAMFIWNDNPDDILVTPPILRLVDERNLTDGNWSYLLDFYLGNESHTITSDKKNAVVQLYSDRLYNYGIHMSALLHALHGHGSIYKYSFEFNGVSHFKKLATDSVKIGASHGDDLLYVFKLPMLEVFPPGQPEIDVIDKLTTILSDFVKFGDPVGSERLSVTWEPVGTLNAKNMHIKYMNMSNANVNSFEGLNLTMGQDLYKKRMDVWMSLPLPENVQVLRYKNSATPTLEMKHFMCTVLPLLSAIYVTPKI